MTNFKKIRTQFLVFIITLIAVTILCLMYGSRTLLVQNAEKQLLKSVEKANVGIYNLMATKLSDLEIKTQVIGELPIFATVLENAIDTDETDTLKDTASQYQKKLNVQIMEVLDSDLDLVLSLNKTFDKNSKTFGFLCAKAEDGDIASSIAFYNHNMCLLALTPIGPPDDPSGYLLTGVLVDKEFLKDICEVSKTNIYIFREGKLLTSNQKEVGKIEISSFKTDVSTVNDEGVYVGGLFKSKSSDRIGKYVLEGSLREMKSNLREIENNLFFICVIIFLVVLFCS